MMARLSASKPYYLTIHAGTCSGKLLDAKRLIQERVTIFSRLPTSRGLDVEVSHLNWRPFFEFVWLDKVRAHLVTRRSHACVGAHGMYREANPHGQP